MSFVPQTRVNCSVSAAAAMGTRNSVEIPNLNDNAKPDFAPNEAGLVFQK
jgi:hypothetical protein